MRQFVFAIAIVFVCASGAARADSVETSVSTSHSCGFNTPYNLQVGDDGVRLYRHDGMPKEVVFHDGSLRVDGKLQKISQIDAQRLRAMEIRTRGLMPAVTDIFRETVNITFDALAQTMRTMTNSKRKARKVERYRTQALDDIDDTLGQGHWDQDAFSEMFEADIEHAAKKMAYSIARSALWAVFTGRAHQLDERAELLDQEMDQLVDARMAALDKQAQALCTRVTALQSLQGALEYRYEGAPLSLLELSAQNAGSAMELTVASRDHAH